MNRKKKVSVSSQKLDYDFGVLYTIIFHMSMNRIK